MLRKLKNGKSSLNSLITSRIVSEETKGKILNWLEDVVSKELTPDKKVDQLFGGFFVKIIKNNFSYIMENTVKSIVKGLSNNQQAIAEVAITTTKENLNFFEIMGYNMLGGDGIISAIVDNLINDKFPAFIESKNGELQVLLGNFIDNNISSSTIGDLDIKLEHNEVLNVINKFIDNRENVSRLNNNIIEITDSMFDYMTEAKIEEFLSILSINKIEDLIDIFKDESIFIEKELKNNINMKKETAST